MSTSTSNIKTICDEYLNSVYTEDQTVKTLNKMIK